jgi:hypothetical protein
MWISFADTARHNLDVIDRITGRSGLVIQPSGVRWAPLVSAPPRDSLAGPVSSFPYPRVPPSAPNELVRLATEVAIGLGTGVASAFIYDAFKSWLDPENGKRIKVRLKDMEISTSEVSADDFRKIMIELQNIKEETEIKTKITKTGIDVKITRRSQNVSDDQS